MQISSFCQSSILKLSTLTWSSNTQSQAPSTKSNYKKTYWTKNWIYTSRSRAPFGNKKDLYCVFPDKSLSRSLTLSKFSIFSSPFYIVLCDGDSLSCLDAECYPNLKWDLGGGQPIRGQCSGHVITQDQWEASIWEEVSPASQSRQMPGKYNNNTISYSNIVGWSASVFCVLGVMMMGPMITPSGDECQECSDNILNITSDTLGWGYKIQAK